MVEYRTTDFGRQCGKAALAGRCASKPQRKLDAETALKIVQYYQRNQAATLSHRKATLAATAN
jgi:hypothetical protein